MTKLITAKEAKEISSKNKDDYDNWRVTYPKMNKKYDRAKIQLVKNINSEIKEFGSKGQFSTSLINLEIDWNSGVASMAAPWIRTLKGWGIPWEATEMAVKELWDELCLDLEKNGFQWEIENDGCWYLKIDWSDSN